MSEGTDNPAAGSRTVAPGGPGDGSGDSLVSAPGRSPVLDAGQLEVLCRYGTERDVAAGEVLFADGDETYDLIVMLDGTAEIIQGYRPGPAPRSSPRTAGASSWARLACLPGSVPT